MNRRGHWLAFAIAALVAVRVLAIAVVLDKPASYATGTAYSNDAANYHRIATHPGTPYRDFAVEFPPVTLAFIDAVDGHDVTATMHHLAWAALAFDVLAAAALAYGWGRRAALAYLVLGLPLLMRPFVYFRVDLLSVALAAWACALVKRRRDAAGGAVLAVAVLAKLWPLALGPALVVKRRWRALTTAAVTGLVGLGWWVAESGTRGIEQVVTFRHAHGWQIESVPGELVRLVTRSSIYKESGAIRTGDMSSAARLVLGLLLVGLTTLVWWKVHSALARGRGEDVAWGPGALAAVAVFMACSPLLSPQYGVWLLPFAAVCWIDDERLLALLSAAACVLTMLLTQQYPSLEAGGVLGHTVLMARNGMLVAIVVVALRTITRPANLPPAPDRAVSRRDDLQRDREAESQVMSSMRWSATRADSAVAGSTEI